MDLILGNRLCAAVAFDKLTNIMSKPFANPSKPEMLLTWISFFSWCLIFQIFLRQEQVPLSCTFSFLYALTHPFRPFVKNLGLLLWDVPTFYSLFLKFTLQLSLNDVSPMFVQPCVHRVFCLTNIQKTTITWALLNPFKKCWIKVVLGRCKRFLKCAKQNK